MSNHVHLIFVPETEDGLRRAIGEAHHRYTRYINLQRGWRGHLQQGRFGSFPMDEQYLIATARYIELNPVRAEIVKNLKNINGAVPGHSTVSRAVKRFEHDSA
jgi:putative transposase